MQQTRRNPVPRGQTRRANPQNRPNPQNRQSPQGRSNPQSRPNPQNPQGRANPRNKPRAARKPTPAQIKQAKREKQQRDPNRVRFFSLDGKIDVPMLVIIMVLLVFGITMMFSAGHALSYRETGNSLYYVLHQLPAAGIGLLGMFALTLFDYRFLRHDIRLFKTNVRVTLAHILLAATMFLNFLTIFIGIRAEIGGQKRWLPMPVIGQFQPSDFLKVAVVIFFAYYIHKNFDKMRLFFYGIAKPVMILVMIVLSIISQMHLSCMLIILMVFAVMLFVGGVNVKEALPIALAAVAAVYLVVVVFKVGYFEERIIYMDPLSDPGDGSYQNYQSALAIGSGGIWGKGFGNSSQKYYYLPEAQNDFVFAILVEEFGLVGGVVVILLFLIFTARGFYIARHAEDKFGCLLATGITFMTGLQAFLNLGVTLCCIPNTGVPLPFFSYGGTALMLQLWEMGLLLSISKRAKLS